MSMRVVILTTSSMTKVIDHNEFKGRCITGLDLATNKVVRFVRNRFGAPVEFPYCLDFHKLDTVEVDVKEACPISCQTENLIVNYHYPDLYGKSEISVHDLFRLYQKGDQSVKHFMSNNYYKLADISVYDHSLEMIKVTNFVVTGNKCSFNYLSSYHALYSLTDPEYKLNEKQSKTYGDAYLVISIPSDPWEGSYYKFVAAVYPIELVKKFQPNIQVEDDEDSQPVIQKNIYKTDCILQNGPSCRGNCTGCTRYRSVAKR